MNSATVKFAGGEGAVTGRFAPSPSGRMHLGNVWAALVSWLCAKAAYGRWLLRIEDLDPQRSKREWEEHILEDLEWLGLVPDAEPVRQSERHDLYGEALERLRSAGKTYSCRCTRADIASTQAPHASDGRVIYPGTCRPAFCRASGYAADPSAPGAVRLALPEGECSIDFTDTIYGRRSIDLHSEFGDIVLRRADGAWAYQLAVVVDDALTGVNQIVRGCDLLDSTACQIWLARELGLTPPRRYVHIPLLCNTAGQRLSKRDSSLSLEALRRYYTAPQLLGHLAHITGLRPDASPVTPAMLLEGFDAATLRVLPPDGKIVCQLTKNE